MKNLKLCLMDLYHAGIKDHPQDVMKQLGIEYKQAVPQSISDSWWFFCCENIPEKLPKYLSSLNLHPMQCIGFGLSEEDAVRLSKNL